MTVGDHQRVVERMATDPEFAQRVEADPTTALAGYDLTDAERVELGGWRRESPVATAAAPAQRTLGTRRSKTSVLGLGAVGIFAAGGAATIGLLNYHPTHTYSDYLTVGGSTQTVTSIEGLPSSGPIDVKRPPLAGRPPSQTITVLKPVNVADANLRSAVLAGRRLGDVTIGIRRDGSPWLVYTIGNALVTRWSNPTLQSAGATTLTEEVTFVGSSVTVSYPNGP